MDENTTLQHLEELAIRIGIKVLYESLTAESSSRMWRCYRISGEDYLIINKRMSNKERIHILIATVKRFDLSEIYIMPALRKILDNQPNHKY